MKRAILTVTLIFRGMAVGQETTPRPFLEPQQTLEPANVVTAAIGPGSSSFGYPSAQQSSTQSQATSQAPSPATQTSPPGKEAARPRPEGSMIGYIEDAIPSSQFRVRSEAGFDAQFPDRAEFFYAKCGCFKQNLAGSGLAAFDPNAPGPGPGVVTKLNFQQFFMQAEYAPHRRFSLFAEVPVRWIQPTAFVPGFGSFPNQSGLGDVTAGFKAAVLASPRHYLTVQVKGYFPTGNAAKGLGTNHYSVEPSVLYYQGLTNRMALESEIGVWHPVGGSEPVATASDPTPQNFAGNVLFYGVGPSYQLVRREHFRFTPVVELVGWTVLGGQETVWISANQFVDQASGTNILNIKIGARTDLGGGNSFYIGFGRALTSAVWYNDLVRFEYRHSF
jgi:hypothetical protein